ncbi:MAG: PDZ domain-containing protein [Clostridiales bacterium]|nr:PDZ domain-containing protein [Clostridiales bacterium]
METIKFYVTAAQDGQADADGTREKPFSSLDQALKASRRHAGRRRLILLPGTYVLERALELSACDRGITLCCEAPGQAVLTGARELGRLPWEPYAAVPGAYCAKIEPGLEPDALYLDGMVQIQARYPNRQPGAVPLEGAATRQEIRRRAKRYRNPKGGHIRAIHKDGWGGNSYLITGRSAWSRTGLSLNWVGDNNRGGEMRDEAVVENVLEELDAPQEWFYDRDSGMLYYVPEKKDDLQGSFSIALNHTLISIMGDDASNPAQDIALEGLAFRNTSRTMFTVNRPGMRYIPLLRGDWCVVPAGVVTCENTKGIAIRDCSFHQIGGNAVFLYGYQEQTEITGNEFSAIGSTAIQVVGKSDAVYEPSFWKHALYPQLQTHKTQVDHPACKGPRTEDYPRDVLIEDNHIDGVGLFEKQSTGVNLSVSMGVRILHNTIHNSARSCINVNDGTFGGHEIAHNDIFDAQRETQDHGPFNSWGRDRFWSVPKYNAGGAHGEVLRRYEKDGQVYDITAIDAVHVTNLHHNRFHHSPDAPHSWGIDLDDGSSYYEICDNLVLGIGLKLREGFGRTVYNNILIDGNINIHVPYAQSGDVLYRNLVVHGKPFDYVPANADRFTAARQEIRDTWVWNGGKQPKLYDFLPAPVSLEDPLFRNPSENDYTVTNKAVLQKFGFRNFDMRGFGKRGCPVQAPAYLPQGGRAEQAEELYEFLGAQCSDITEAIISSTASSGYEGVYVAEAPEDSPAYTAGLRQRDIIKQVKGRPCQDYAAFAAQWQALKPGGKLKVTVYRNNDWVKLKLKKHA